MVNKKTSKTRNGNFALYDLWDHSRCAPDKEGWLELKEKQRIIYNLSLACCDAHARRINQQDNWKTMKMDFPAWIWSVLMDLHQTYV